MTSEVEGTSVNAQLHGLVLADKGLPLRVDERVKIVWRMTGAGPLTATANAASGRAVPLTFGPEPHARSTYNRPGDEWGTGYLFDGPGCWHLAFRRTTGSADVWLDIVR